VMEVNTDQRRRINRNKKQTDAIRSILSEELLRALRTASDSDARELLVAIRQDAPLPDLKTLAERIMPHRRSDESITPLSNIVLPVEHTRFQHADDRLRLPPGSKASVSVVSQHHSASTTDDVLLSRTTVNQMANGEPLLFRAPDPVHSPIKLFENTGLPPLIQTFRDAARSRIARGACVDDITWFAWARTRSVLSHTNCY